MNGKIIALVTLLTLTPLLSSCGAVRTYYADLKYEEEKNDMGEPDAHSDKFMYELADRFGLMALFADVAYRDDLRTLSKTYGEDGYLISEVLISDTLDSACDYLDSEEPLPSYGMPSSTDPSTKDVGYWARWRGSDSIASSPCFNEEGLFYETYVYYSPEAQNRRPEEAVIAFRGTENEGAQLWLDWRTNLTGAFGFEPRQYELASTLVPEVIAALKAENPDVKIFTTGHSLGGGLAQQAGYLSKDVLEVFTFNTSPVTNWTSLARRGEVRNQFPVFHRVYNGGEVLGGLRDITTLFTKARYNRHDIGIQVQPKDLIAGHSMTLISCHFACLIERQGDTAAHQLTPTYIAQELIGEAKHCQGYVDLGECALRQ
ncbi:MAG: DUF6792 domain-containing protein [Pseudomonadota bacterium]